MRITTHNKIYLNCKYIPPEIFAAIDMIPYRLWPSVIKKSGLGLLPYDVCPYIRSFLSKAIEDKNCTIYAANCDGMRRAYDVTENSYLMESPRLFTDKKIDDYYRQLLKLLRKFNIDYKKPEYKSKLIKTIAQFNQQRYLLQQLRYKLSKSNRDSFCILLEAIKYHYSQNMESIKTLISNISVSESNNKDYKNKIFKSEILISSSCLLDNSIIKLIDNNKDLMITGLDSCLGERSFNFYVNINDKDDPLFSLARDYLTGPACPRMMAPERRLKEIIQLVQKRQVDGIIYFIPKFCDQANYDFKLLKDSNLLNIPILRIEGEYQAGKSGQLNTRITAFKEALEIKNKKDWLNG